MNPEKVEGRLPQRARELLSTAAAQRRDVRMKAIKEAIKVVQTMYPEFFHKEPQK